MCETLILIIGASGVGKTTVAKELEKHFLNENSAVYYFDDIGIPNLDEMTTKYGSPQQWQKTMVHSWIERLHKIRDKKTIILEGSFYPEFALEKMQELGIDNYQIICIHTEKNIRENRLIEERNQPELATQDMENYARILKERTIAAKGIVIDSTGKTIQDVALEINNTLGDMLCKKQFSSLSLV